MLKLYVKRNNKFEEIAGLAIGPGLQEIKNKKIADCISQYLKEFTAYKCAKNQASEASYFKILEKYLRGKQVKFAHEVLPQHFDDLAKIFLRRMKPNSLNRRFSVYRHFFTMCAEKKYVYESPFNKIKQRKIVKCHFTPWTEADFNKFLTATSGTYSKLFKFLWLTGCRPMELKNLKWCDIDYENRNIIFECGKNKNGKRNFPLTDPVSRLLHTMKADTQFVFSIAGKQVENDNLYQYAKHRLKALGLVNLTVYGLRHSFACGLNNEDVNAFTIKDLLGHSDIRTTLNYVHSNSASLTAALKKAKR